MNEKEQQEFERIVQIDTHILDDELQDHIRLVWRYGLRLAEAQSLLDKAEANLKVVTAKVDDGIRTKSSKVKLTEVDIKHAILRSKGHQQATLAVIDAKRDYNHLYAAIRTLDHRRTSLSNYVRLQEQNYIEPRRRDPSEHVTPRFKPISSKKKSKGKKR